MRGPLFRASRLFLQLCLGVSIARAQPSPSRDIVRDAAGVGGTAACTKEQVRKARAQARKALEKRQFKAAVDHLRRLTGACELRPGQPDHPDLDYFWVYSDLAFAAYKSGNFAECLQILAPLATPKPPVSVQSYGLEGTKVGRAIVHTEGLCAKAHEAQHTDFQSAPCSLKPQKHDVSSAIELPQEAVPRPRSGSATVETACLALKGGAPHDQYRKALDDDNAQAAELCPRVVMLSRLQGQSTISEVLLHASEGPLGDTSDCCNVERLTVAARAGKRLVRVTGGGRDCFGGTADKRLDATYDWSGDDLLLFRNDFATRH